MLLSFPGFLQSSTAQTLPRPVEGRGLGPGTSIRDLKRQLMSRPLARLQHHQALEDQHVIVLLIMSSSSEHAVALARSVKAFEMALVRGYLAPSAVVHLLIQAEAGKTAGGSRTAADSTAANRTCHVLHAERLGENDTSPSQGRTARACRCRVVGVGVMVCVLCDCKGVLWGEL